MLYNMLNAASNDELDNPAIKEILNNVKLYNAQEHSNFGKAGAERPKHPYNNSSILPTKLAKLYRQHHDQSPEKQAALTAGRPIPWVITSFTKYKMAKRLKTSECLTVMTICQPRLRKSYTITVKLI